MPNNDLKEAIVSENVTPNDGRSDEADGAVHHSHHHRHHSKAYYRYRRKKHKVKKFIKKHPVAVSVTVSVLVLGLLSVLLWQGLSGRTAVSESELSSDITAESVSNDAQLSLVLPAISEPQLLVRSAVNEYANSEELLDLSTLLVGIDTKERLDQGLSVTLPCSITSLPAGVSLESSSVTVSENADFSDGVTFENALVNQSVTLRYLKTGTTYYYRVTATLSNGSSLNSEGQFQTASTPRILSIDGIANVRDIGGWKTADGKQIRQGLLYRGSELDGRYDASLKITDSGIVDVHNYLGIVAEFDLRKASGALPQQSTFGTNITYNTYAIQYYNSIFSTAQQQELGRLFSDLAQESNYPLYMHCTYGLDRTGTVCYLLEALLGLDDVDLIKEYELSGFCYTDQSFRSPDSDFSLFVKEFQNLEGNTTQEKAENYLLSCGVTSDELAKIKEILLEDAS